MEKSYQIKGMSCAACASKVEKAVGSIHGVSKASVNLMKNTCSVVFDDALVSQPLAWLKDYPDAKKAWSKALREYANNSNGKASDIADLFRKALETFFHEFFGKDQTLQKLKPVYGGYLKSRGIPPEITQNYESILQSYITFMDAYAKHHDATSDKVLEYLMYQTGNIMRLLITLKQGEKKDAD